MPDPLAQVAAELAPRPTNGTNYLDPAAGRDVIARYGQSRMLGDSLEGALRLDNLATRSRLDRARAAEYEAGAGLRARERDLIGRRFDQEEQDLADRQAAKEARVELIAGLVGLDPEAEDYADIRNKLVGTMPRGVLEDDVVQDIMGSLDKRYQEAERLRRTAEEKRLQQEKEIAVLRERMKQKAGFEGVTPEMVQKYTAPDGSVDIIGLSFEAGQQSRAKNLEQKRGEADIRLEGQKEMENLRQKNRMELQGNAAERRALETRAKRAVERIDEFPEAFPPQIDVLRQAFATQYLAGENKDFTGTKEDIPKAMEAIGAVKTMKQFDEKVAAEFPTEYAEAVEWDKKRVERETEAARSRTEEGYINLVQDRLERMPAEEAERVREARSEFWQSVTGNMAPQGVAPEAQPRDETRTDAVTPKKITPEIEDEYLSRAGFDPVKAAEMLRADGYGE